MFSMSSKHAFYSVIYRVLRLLVITNLYCAFPETQSVI